MFSLWEEGALSSTAEAANFPTLISERMANDQCCWDSQLQSELSFKAKNGDNVLMMGEPGGIAYHVCK